MPRRNNELGRLGYIWMRISLAIKPVERLLTAVATLITLIDWLQRGFWLLQRYLF